MSVRLSHRGYAVLYRRISVGLVLVAVVLTGTACKHAPRVKAPHVGGTTTTRR